MKSKRNTQSTKLTLSRETVRQLGNDALANVAGGIFTSDQCNKTTTAKHTECACQTF